MAALADRAPSFEIEDFLAQEQAKDLLRFSTAGSVDDGKSTLIGRLLYDSQNVYEDQIKAVTKASVNRSAGPIDFSLLTDGLRAEREQGITIDVAYRYFATARRKFIIADTPGHEQYTRNMATGASTADLAIILIDARNGVLAAIAPPRFHRFSAGHSELRDRGEQNGPGRLRRARLPRHRGRVRRFPRATQRAAQVTFCRSARWSATTSCAAATRCRGSTVPACWSFSNRCRSTIARAPAPSAFRCSASSGPTLDFRGYAGQIASGSIRPGDAILRVSFRPPLARQKHRDVRWTAG